jgi:mono/diheme cytochrome c family protein
MMSTTGRPGAPSKNPVGQKIYNLGMTPKGPVKFTGGGSAVGNGACANCHGSPARGGTAPMISLSMLMYGGKMGNMPKVKYANTDAIFTTLTTGVRPDGSQLNANMPRYKLSRADFDQLAAFLLRQ